MIPLDVILQGDGCWPDLRGRSAPDCTHVRSGGDGKMAVAVLERGMTSGKPSVALRIDLPDGRTVVAETSARLFCTAARMIMAKYPDLFEGE